jgi:parallel beta-helix repeat protein
MAEQCRATRVIMLSLAVALALAGTAALLGLMGTLAEAHAAPYTTRYVSATTGSDGLNKCNLIGSPCRTIQHAVDVANSGDVILVATGIYSDLFSCPVPDGYIAPPTSGQITQVVFISKSISIRGGYTTAFDWPPSAKKNPTTLSTPKTKKGRLIVIAGDISPAIYDLRLTKGDATGLGGAGGGTAHDAGGGVYILSATATLNNNQIYDNAATEGGGVYLYESDSTLSGNVVTTNTADYGGGLSLRASDATLSGNTILSNTAVSNGGGVHLNYSNATLSGNTVTSNTAGDSGGGLFLNWQSAATLSGNTILSNTALYGGGGLYANYSNATLSGNTILYNSVRDEGGGLHFVNDSRARLDGDIVMANSASTGGGLYVERSNPTLTNTVIADNQAVREGGAVYVLAGAPRLLHTTIARNTGGSGVYVVDSGGGTYSTVALTNTILVSHTLGIAVAAGNVASLESTLWYGNTDDWGGAGTIVTGTRNYWDDPRFDLDGYHLLTDSAAISKGVSAGVTTDIDNQPRDANPDLGVDEWPAETIYLPLILRS